MSEATRIGAVVLPRKVVELKSLRDTEGRPVCVIVERVDELVIKRIVKRLPGIMPQTAVEKAAAPAADVDRDVPQLLEYAEPLIEAAVRMPGADGVEVQAFWFEAEVAGAIPGRLLGIVDRVLLFNEILQLGGWLGGATEEVRFHDGEQRGVGDGVGDLEAVPGDRAAAAPAAIPWATADPTGS